MGQAAYDFGVSRVSSRHICDQHCTDNPTPRCNPSFQPKFELRALMALSQVPMEADYRLSASVRAWMALADELDEQIALLDMYGNILAVNRSWSLAGAPNLVCELTTGDNYLRFCQTRAAIGDEDCRGIADALWELALGGPSEFERLDLSDRKTSGRSYRLRVRTMDCDGGRVLLLARYDMTELLRLRRQRKRLGDRLMNAQEDERRKLARELHDSTAQDLVALQFSLMQFKPCRHSASPDLAAVHESLERVQREIRSVSYLYHPPALDDFGLAAAIRTMCEGFGRRTGLKINLCLDYRPTRVTHTERAVYRLVQEALANIHRHAKASEVDVHLMATEHRVHIMIRDDGVGFNGSADGPVPVGVGITAMRERVDELGGRLSFHSMAGGASVVASLPLGDVKERASAPAALPAGQSRIAARRSRPPATSSAASAI